MNRLIFLDIDGVLNSTRFIEETTGGEGVVIVNGEFDATAHIDPSRVTRLNALIAATGSRVILSSSWRQSFGMEKTQRSLRARGFAHELADCTARFVGEDRHAEIRHYLSTLAEPPSFVILDDAVEAGIGFGERFVHVADGLEDAHVDRCVELLGRPGTHPQRA
jgi:hypothetical protein